MLELLPENDTRLHDVCVDWNFETDGDPSAIASELFLKLVETNALGIAAPQCGIMKRLVVIGNLSRMNVFVNPSIVSASTEEAIDTEGCLSFPDLWLKIKRPRECNIRYQTIEGEWTEETLTGMAARIAQHEMDHLDGITFDTKSSKLGLKMAKEKRRKSF